MSRDDRRDPQIVVALVGLMGVAGSRRDQRPDGRRDLVRHPLGPARDRRGPAGPPPAAIVITGTALPEAKAERVYGVDRIGRREIEQSPSHELDQLLKDVPGLQLFRRSDARSGHPTSQGVTLRALGGNASSRALLVLDGVPQSDPFGGWVNWPAYDPADLAQVRVVRGGGSVGNGPGALAGTIDMTSRSDTGVSGEVDGGSRDSLEARGRAGVSAGGGTLSLSGRFERSDGFIPITSSTRGPADERAPYREWSGRGRWVVPLGGETEAQASVDGVPRLAHARHGLQHQSHQRRRRIASPGWARPVAVERARILAMAQSDEQLRQRQYGRASATRVSLQDSVPSHGLGGSVELRPPMPAGIELRLGADARRTDGESRELFTYVAGEPTRRRFAGGETCTSGAFAEASGGARRGDADAGRAARSLADQRRAFVRAAIATGAVLRDEHDAPRDGWLPTARGGVSAQLGGGLSCARRPISAGGCRP